MPKRGKTYKAMAEKVEKAKLYDVAEAMQLVTEVGGAKFDKTIEVHVRLGVVGRHAHQ